MGRRVEMGWWTMSRLRTGADPGAPLLFEGDEREARGMSGSEQDYFATNPWLFAATHNMSMATDTFHKVGGFDEAMAGWGYEDNEFLYRVFRFFGRQKGHFQYDPELVCYHMPHFRDWSTEWENTRTALAHIKNRHRHYDVELLSHPPNHLRISQTLPYYGRCLDHLRAVSNARTAAKAAAVVPQAVGRELWIGCDVTEPISVRTDAVAFDHGRPDTDGNHHLLGAALPVEAGALGAVINLDVWRILTPVDLSAVVLEGLRVAPVLYLATSKHLADEPAHRLKLADDLGYVEAMLAPHCRADVYHDDDEVAVLRLR
jgi:hypothetical protein